MERFQTELELANERDLLSTLLENIPDRIYFKDRESRFILINRALTDLLHFERAEQAYGKSDADFYGEEHARQALKDERRVMNPCPINNRMSCALRNCSARAAANSPRSNAAINRW